MSLNATAKTGQTKRINEAKNSEAGAWVGRNKFLVDVQGLALSISFPRGNKVTVPPAKWRCATRERSHRCRRRAAPRSCSPPPRSSPRQPSGDWLCCPSGSICSSPPFKHDTWQHLSACSRRMRITQAPEIRDTGTHCSSHRPSLKWNGVSKTVRNSAELNSHPSPLMFIRLENGQAHDPPSAVTIETRAHSHILGIAIHEHGGTERPTRG